MEFKKGDKVTYIPTLQKGIVKASPPNSKDPVLVVFHCNDDWQNYDNYRGDPISPVRLHLGWIEEV